MLGDLLAVSRFQVSFTNSGSENWPRYASTAFSSFLAECSLQKAQDSRGVHRTETVSTGVFRTEPSPCRLSAHARQDFIPFRA